MTIDLAATAERRKQLELQQMRAILQAKTQFTIEFILGLARQQTKITEEDVLQAEKIFFFINRDLFSVAKEDNDGKKGETPSGEASPPKGQDEPGTAHT